MHHRLSRRVLAGLFAVGLLFGVASCDTEEDDTTELEDESEDLEEQVDEGVNQGQTDEDQGDS